MLSNAYKFDLITGFSWILIVDYLAIGSFLLILLSVLKALFSTSFWSFCLALKILFSSSFCVNCNYYIYIVLFEYSCNKLFLFWWVNSSIYFIFMELIEQVDFLFLLDCRLYFFFFDFDVCYFLLPSSLIF